MAKNISAIGTLNPLTDLPSCALTCLIEKVPEAGCGLLDTACQCASVTLTHLASNCMTANCTLEDSMKLVQFDAIQCARPHDSQAAIVWSSIVLTSAITYLMLILRFISRFVTVGAFWWDDWFHLIAGIFTVPLNVMAILMAVHGMGRHLYDIDTSYVTDLLYWFYHLQYLWAFNVLFVKMSILALYLRIFPEKHFRWQVYATMGIMCLIYTITQCLIILQCIPVRASWLPNQMKAKCLSVEGVAMTNAGVNLLTEIVILLLPLPMLKALQLPLRQKIPLFALFGMGSLVIAIAAARTPNLRGLQYRNDPTYDHAPSYYWSCAETAVIHFCAAAPAIRSLFVKAKNVATTNAKSYGPTSSFRSDKKISSNASKGKIVSTTSVSVDIEKTEQPDIEMSSMGESKQPRHIAYQYDPNNNPRSHFNTTITASSDKITSPTVRDSTNANPHPTPQNKDASWDQSSRDSILDRHNYLKLK